MAVALPSQETFSLARSLSDHFVTPILRAYSLQCGLQPPSPSLQLQTTYYETQTSLAKHRDPAFLNGIVGPATGLAIYPGDGPEKVEASLETGDVIIYTGFEFQDFYCQRASRVPPPLPHSVAAEAGRMSILFACLMPSLE